MSLNYSKTNAKSGKVRVIRREYDFVPEQARWLLYENQIKLHEQKPVSKRTETHVYTGMESLRYLGVARRFICAKFDLTYQHLEIFLYMAPFNYFTIKDYDRIAKPYIGYSIQNLRKNGYVVAMFKKEELKRPNLKHKDIADIYALSRKAKTAVTQFYKIISGEMEPNRFKTAVYSKDDTKNKLIKELLEEMKEEL